MNKYIIIHNPEVDIGDDDVEENKKILMDYINKIQIKYHKVNISQLEKINEEQLAFTIKNKIASVERKIAEVKRSMSDFKNYYDKTYNDENKQIYEELANKLDNFDYWEEILKVIGVYKVHHEEFYINISNKLYPYYSREIKEIDKNDNTDVLVKFIKLFIITMYNYVTKEIDDLQEKINTTDPINVGTVDKYKNSMKKYVMIKESLKDNSVQSDIAKYIVNDYYIHKYDNLINTQGYKIVNALKNNFIKSYVKKMQENNEKLKDRQNLTAARNIKNIMKGEFIQIQKIQDIMPYITDICDFYIIRLIYPDYKIANKIMLYHDFIKNHKTTIPNYMYSIRGYCSKEVSCLTYKFYPYIDKQHHTCNIDD